MLLTRNTNSDDALAHACFDACRGLLQRFNPLFSPLFSNSVIGLIEIQRRAADGRDLTCLEVIEDDFDALRTNVDTQNRGHDTQILPILVNIEHPPAKLPVIIEYVAIRQRLHDAGRPLPTPLPAGTYARRILEPLLVELSWASSRMEGNTYDILETRRLIRFGEEAIGKDRKEAVMTFDHKEAIQTVVDHLADITISRLDVFGIHALLADGLLIDPAMAGQLRRMPIGVSQSSYRPLDDRFLIEEEFDLLIQKAERITDPFEQSFFLLVHIPYLQAFNDVNKRTSRIAANIPLLKADLAPLSFLTMDDASYIDGLIGVYEINNVSLLREIYVDAYLASAENYTVLRAELESPSKAALVYREFVRRAVRRNVLEWKEFRRGDTVLMAAEARIPDADLEQVIDYIGNEVRSLHEGNAIRYRLSAGDLAPMRRDDNRRTPEAARNYLECRSVP